MEWRVKREKKEGQKKRENGADKKEALVFFRVGKNSCFTVAITEPANRTRNRS